MSDDRLERWTQSMLAGDFETAWRVTDEIEFRRRQEMRQPHFARQSFHLLWDGTPVEGRHVAIRCRHGLGDSIQFLRYLPALRRSALSVAVDLQPDLKSIFPSRIDSPSEAPDVEIESMELPYVFRTVPATIPSAVPYIRPKVDCRGQEPRRFVRPCRDLNVGLVWAAGPWNRARSLRETDLRILESVNNVRFYSLQQGPDAANVRDFRFPVVSFGRRTAQVRAAAAAMAELDLIISVDSMPAHLAGALGRPVWTLLMYHADWRWMSTGEATPWYPTMRLFRQGAPGDWESALENVACQLRQFLPSRPLT